MSDRLVVFDLDPRQEPHGGDLKVAAKARFVASYLVSDGWKAKTETTEQDLARDAVNLLGEQLNWHMADGDGEIERIEEFLVSPDDERFPPDSPVIAAALWRLASWQRVDPTRSNHHAEQIAHTLLTRRFIRMADNEPAGLNHYFEMAVTDSR